jgi:hypothetical protein
MERGVARRRTRAAVAVERTPVAAGVAHSPAGAGRTPAGAGAERIRAEAGAERIRAEAGAERIRAEAAVAVERTPVAAVAARTAGLQAAHWAAASARQEESVKVQVVASVQQLVCCRSRLPRCRAVAGRACAKHSGSPSIDPTNLLFARASNEPRWFAMCSEVQ